MNLMQVFLEAFKALGNAESALARGLQGLAQFAGIDTARLSVDAHGVFRPECIK